MTPLTTSQLSLLAPNARSVYVTAFGNADAVFAKYGTNDTPLRLAHFMAQVLHETGGLMILVESMNYSAPRLPVVWPSRFPNTTVADAYAHNPEKLANFVYGGRMGNTGPDDGWRYIGRGLLQITGRESYAKYGAKLGIDLVANPDLAASSDWCLQVAAEEYTACGCNEAADRDDLRAVTKLVNGGYIGIDERQAWLKKTKSVWMPPAAPAASPQANA
jgi:putative chitinase